MVEHKINMYFISLIWTRISTIFRQVMKSFTMQYRSVFATCKNMNIFVTNMYTDEYKSTYGMPIRYGLYRTTIVIDKES